MTFVDVILIFLFIFGFAWFMTIILLCLLYVLIQLSGGWP